MCFTILSFFYVALAIVLSQDYSCYDTCSVVESVDAVISRNFECINGDIHFNSYTTPDCSGNSNGPISMSTSCIDCNSLAFYDYKQYERGNCSGDITSNVTNSIYIFSSAIGKPDECTVQESVSRMAVCDKRGYVYDLYRSSDCSGKKIPATGLRFGCSSDQDITAVTCPGGTKITYEPFTTTEYTYENNNNDDYYYYGVFPFPDFYCINDDFCASDANTTSSYTLSCDGKDWKYKTYSSTDCSGSATDSRSMTAAEAEMDCPACPEEYVDVTLVYYNDEKCSEKKTEDRFGIITNECVEYEGYGSVFVECEDDVAMIKRYESADCKGEPVNSTMQESYKCDDYSTSETIQCASGTMYFSLFGAMIGIIMAAQI